MTTERTEQSARESLDEFLFIESPYRYFVALALAGMVYASSYTLYLLVATSELQPANLLPLLCAVLVISAVVSVTAGAVAMLVALWIQLLLGIRVENHRFLAFSGGIVGLFALVPVLVVEPWSAELRMQGIERALYGSAIITPLFQLAGGWGVRRSPGSRAGMYRWRFGIGQILIATAWLGLILALLKMMELLTLWVVAWVTGWAIYQWLTLQVVMWLLGKRSGYVLEGGMVGG